ncbi:peptidase inhibitor family I36 protein [Amycolatopsis sp. H6(2020)]|nr:peptidase inhibitor family I36 protein [Amycolatopsis sp. H6(2020)]
MKHRLAIFLTTAVTGLMLLGGTSIVAAAPASDTTQEQIDAILAAHPGGVQAGKNRITWNNGVALKLGAEAAGEEECESGNLCLWEHDHFGGRLLMAYPEALCGVNLILNLKDFGYNDMASSWKNRSTKFGDVWDDYGAGGTRLWRMFPGFKSVGLPKEFNDKASSFTC